MLIPQTTAHNPAQSLGAPGSLRVMSCRDIITLFRRALLVFALGRGSDQSVQQFAKNGSQLPYKSTQQRQGLGPCRPAGCCRAPLCAAGGAGARHLIAISPAVGNHSSSSPSASALQSHPHSHEILSVLSHCFLLQERRNLCICFENVNAMFLLRCV